MEAKDTVMSGDGKCDIADAFMVVYPRLQLKGQNALLNLIDEVAQTQAEFSFKAGTREVVEWLQEEQAEPDWCLDKWQAKLKEWGIE